MDDLDRYIDEQLKNPKFAEIWNDDQMEYELTTMLIAARNEQRLSQVELAQKAGLRQSNISRIENGTTLPSLRTLSRIACGLGKKLQISFV